MRLFPRFLAFVLALPVLSFAQDVRYRPIDLVGNWSFVFDGALVNKGVGIPVTATGLMTLDAGGRITRAVRTLNLGGQVIPQLSTGRLTMNDDGTGSAEFVVTIQGPGGVSIPFSTETFFFVVTADGQQIQGIGGSAKAPNGDELGALVVKATIIRQGRSRLVVSEVPVAWGARRERPRGDDYPLRERGVGGESRSAISESI